MEELQDAIEDAQYMNAMHDDTPKPTKAWVFPSDEQLHEFMDALSAKDPDEQNAERLCSNPLGLYLFTRFCRENGDQVQAEFVLDVAAFKVALGRGKEDLASVIWESYLREASEGNPKTSSQPDLFRFPTNTTLPEHYHCYLSEESPCALRLTGAPYTELVGLLQNREFGAVDNEPIGRNVFDAVELIVFKYLTDKHMDGFKESELYIKYFKFLYLQRKPVTEDDFTLFRVLGRGGFGLVNGCKKCTTGKLYAMKMMNKKRVKMKKSEELCLNERRILAMVESPFVVCLKYSFTTDSDLFLILDLMTGGDLGFHLGNRGRFTSAEAKYFAARTLLGIAHLHEHSIVYRDLKPENILMDEFGFTKISDLGLACQVVPHLTGTCGTRGYWAPDMLRRDSKGKRIPYNQTVDWFSFGCVIYEFLCGVSPFRTEQAKTWGGYEKKDKDKAIDRATLEMDPVFDDYFDDEARDICFRLLDKDPLTRLGANGVQEIMDHPWFGTINWDDMISERVEPPFKPKKDINAASQQEIGGFSDDKASRNAVLTSEDQAVYSDWDWTSPSAFQEEIVEFMRAEEILGGPITPIVPRQTCCCCM